VSEFRKVLSIDGGGIRGVIPAAVLTEIETRTGRRIAELFDLIAGTSTGGILALGLVKPGEGGDPQYTASQLGDLYSQEGPRIFSRPWWHTVAALDNLADEKYASDGIESVLEKYFGEARLKDALTEVLVTSYELETREPWFFARHKARGDPADDFPMRFVARATSAAPTYFEPEEVKTMRPSGGLVDGGVYANNPAMCAFVEMKKLDPVNEDILLASVGTGQHTDPIHYADAKGWGLAKWAVPILDVVFDGVSDTVDHQMSVLCKESAAHDPRYFRFQTKLTNMTDDMDNASPANIAALKRKAQELIAEKSVELDTLCSALTS
jgi:patatin-like phospholipase/acyl hydrolase